MIGWSIILISFILISFTSNLSLSFCATCWASDLIDSEISFVCSFGTINVWPSVSGLISRIAIPSWLSAIL